MRQTSEEKTFQRLLKRVKDLSIYEDAAKNSLDKNVVKKIAVLFEIFEHINRSGQNSCGDFLYVNDLKHCLKHDNFVKTRFHLIPLERKRLGTMEERNLHFITGVTPILTNLGSPVAYDQLLNGTAVDDEEKLKHMLRRISEIESACITKYRSDSNLKLTFDIFCHNFYIFLSYDYKKHLHLRDFRNKYTQAQRRDELKYDMSQCMLELNSLGVAPANAGEYEGRVLGQLAPFVYESEFMIREFHTNRRLQSKNLELENDFFLKNGSYEERMNSMLEFEKVKSEYKRLKKNIKLIEPQASSGVINYI